MDITLVPPVLGVVGLVIAYILYLSVKRYPPGEGKVVEIGNAIHLGAMVFIKREYSLLAMFAAVILILLYISLGVVHGNSSQHSHYHRSTYRGGGQRINRRLLRRFHYGHDRGLCRAAGPWHLIPVLW